MIAMQRVRRPVGEARDDYTIFGDLARLLNAEEAFTEGRDAAGWLRRLYEDCRPRAARAGVDLPPFDTFWEAGFVRLVSGRNAPPVMLQAFREDPERHALKTPSGRIEIGSERIAGFGLPDCPGHPVWREPVEWLGSPVATRFPLHLISDQPATKLHSQLDASPHSAADKIGGRQPVCMHPDDAAARGLADGAIVRVFNDRGACLAGLRVTDAMRPGVVRMSTGAWYDPDPAPGAPERHGNPNVLTNDIGASGLSQGTIAQTCLVDIAAWEGELPDITVHRPPVFVGRTMT
jgi:biotin/methionine sulfoxide reductase